MPTIPDSSPGSADTLDELALLYGTDKASDGHGYTRFYEQYLEPVRDWPLVLVELGVFHGASLLMWQHYLPNAQVVGVDRSHITIDLPRVHVWEADQTADWIGTKVHELYGGIDVVIDDASHLSSKTIRSFTNLFPHLNPGGLYVIEDLQTAYDSKHYGREEASEHPDEPTSYGTPTAMQFCRRLADEVNHGLYPEEFWLGYDIVSVHFLPNCCFITKA